MTYRQQQKNMIGFLLAYPNDLIPYRDDQRTVEIVCSLVNLRIATIHDNQMCLRSKWHAEQFLNN